MRNCIHRIIMDSDNETLIAKVKGEVNEKMKGFGLYE